MLPRSQSSEELDQQDVEKTASTSTIVTNRADLNKVVRPGILLFIDQILVAAGAWIFWLVISKLTPSSEIGIATAFYSLAMLATTVSQLGLEYPLLKRSSSERSKILGTVITLEVVLTALSIPVLLYIAGIMYGKVATAEYVWLTAGIVILTSLGFVSRFALLGISDVKNVLMLDMAGTGVKFASGFLLVSQGYGGIGILMSFMAYNAIILIGTLAAAKKHHSFGLGSMSYAREILREGLANLPSKLSKMFIMNLGVVLLAFIGTVTSSDLGVFYIELMISLAAGSLASSMAYMILPTSSAKKGNGPDPSTGAIRIGLGLTAILVTILLVAPAFILSLIGPNYASEEVIFTILCLSIIPAAILNSSIAKLNSSSKLRALVIIGSVQITAFLLAFFALSPLYGLTGAAVSILAAFAIAAALSLAWSHDRSFLLSIAASSSAILAGWLAGYSTQVLQLPILSISVSVAVAIAALFGTRCISISDIRTVLSAGRSKGGGVQDIAYVKPKTILVLGNYGNFNIGDEMLLRAVVRDITGHTDGSVEFQVPTRNPGFVEVYHKADSHLIKPLPINASLQLLRGFFKSDAIVVGGGGIWSGYTGPLAHLIPIVTIAGKLLGKQAEFRAIGLYSTASKADRLLVNLAVSLADSCSVRDRESYQLLWKMNRKKARPANDLAVQHLRGLSPEDLASAPLPEDTKKSLSRAKESAKLIVGISVKPVKTTAINDKITSEFSAAIDSLNAKYPGRIHFVFFPFAKTHSKVESDDRLSEAIRSHLSNGDNVTIFEHSDPLSWFNAIKEYVDLFIGMRFHSIIFASEAIKPILCIPYENKITEFLKERHGDPTISEVSLGALESSRIVKFVDEQMKRMLSRETAI
jgi:polysaccharide pyruvyl transferase WcaK-like protein/O-antigen/teichoic acid export membrane protein